MAEVPELLRTALFGRYDLQRELGRGGMATVYLAQDLKNHRLVAIKVLKEELTAAVERARFLREIEIAARLSHPHILPLFDSGEAGELLYYVMPYVEGESLRERIAREKQLRLRDVLTITREVAQALDYAHAQGIVHRDVKPGNVMLSGGVAVVADFGIARAVRRSADDATLTDARLAIGTPLYMSPEQASGSHELDGRSDIYSLGCVVYEMLAGDPPFPGPSTQVILARHMFDPPPPLRSARPSVSAAFEQVVFQSLAKVAADRFETAAEFAAELEAASIRPEPQPIRTEPQPIPIWRWAAAGGAALAGVAIWVAVGGGTGPGGDGTAGDTTQYAILPFRYEQGVSPLGEEQRLRDALSRWSGITVVDPFKVQEAIGGRDGAALSASDAAKVARKLKAGRYFRAEVSRRGSSLRVRAFLLDARQGASLYDAAIEVSAERTNVGPAFATLTDSLLLHGSRLPPRRASGGTMSLPARQAYARGHRAVEDWDLVAADSAFAAATIYDDQYAQAFLWLAQVRAWAVAPPVGNRSTAAWRSAAERASAADGRLPPNERVMADALLSLAQSDYRSACRWWRDLARADSLDFVAWYGLGSCLAADEAVVRDHRSPSGWSFRSSYHEAMRAYQRAFQQMPSMHRALRVESYQAVRALLRTNPNVLRRGQAAPPDTGAFEAYPAWQGDTLAFVPYKRARHLASTNVAVRRQRQMFHEIALAWVIAYPTSDDAMQALALSLEMLGDPAALDTMRRAATLAATPRARVRITGAEVWMRVRLSTPDDLAGLVVARARADSLLRSHPPPDAPEPVLLASLAALLGQGGRAAAYMRQTSVRTDWTIPGPIANSAAPLLVFAALGGPLDSLRVLEQDLTAAIDRAIPAEDRVGLRAMWLARAASLAFPHYRFATLGQLGGIGDYLVDAQVALTRGDTNGVQRMADSIAEVRRVIPPEQRTLDGVYPEAALLAESGDTARAVAWLDPTLNSISSIAPAILYDPTRAASLVRAMALRVELAAQQEDNLAVARWSAPVEVLWAGAEPFLMPLVHRMRGLAR